MRNDEDRYILFDWAFKRILRQKANFDILEGFLTELLEREVVIIELLESESNRPRESGKQNRVDLLASIKTPEDAESILAGKEETVFIELQISPDPHFFHRVLFGASRLVSERLDEGDDYDRVPKVISVSIVHFPLGVGDDYIYLAENKFLGVRTGNQLELGLKRKIDYKVDALEDIFPQYYVLNLHRYADQLERPIDQWIYFLKHSRPPEAFDAKGLRQAEQRLRVMKMQPEERRAYERFIEERREAMSWQSDLLSWQMDGVFTDAYRQGKEDGVEEGVEKEKREMARKLLAKGLSAEEVAELTGLTEEEIARLDA